MDLTPFIRKDQQVIQSYSGGRFRVSNAVYEEAVLVMPDSTVSWEKTADCVASLSLKDFQQIIDIADETDVLLLGAGAMGTFLDSALKKALSEAGLPVDIMGSGAACRTYNVLMAEGRRVVAALFPI